MTKREKLIRYFLINLATHDEHGFIVCPHCKEVLPPEYVVDANSALYDLETELKPNYKGRWLEIFMKFFNKE